MTRSYWRDEEDDWDASSALKRLDEAEDELDEDWDEEDDWEEDEDWDDEDSEDDLDDDDDDLF